MFYASRVLMLCVLAGLVLPLQAMEIQQFDKMADKDQDEYVGELVVRAERVLRDAGRRDLAVQLNKLFTEHQDPADKISLGMAEFQMILARGRVFDLRSILQDPKALRLHVEDAMALTLKPHGIEMPDSFFTVMKDWKPKFPPKQTN